MVAAWTEQSSSGVMTAEAVVGFAGFVALQLSVRLRRFRVGGSSSQSRRVLPSGLMTITIRRVFRMLPKSLLEGNLCHTDP